MPTCIADGCENERPQTKFKPALYCSPTCREREKKRKSRARQKSEEEEGEQEEGGQEEEKEDKSATSTALSIIIPKDEIDLNDLEKLSDEAIMKKYPFFAQDTNEGEEDDDEGDDEGDEGDDVMEIEDDVDDFTNGTHGELGYDIGYYDTELKRIEQIQKDRSRDLVPMSSRFLFSDGQMCKMGRDEWEIAELRLKNDANNLYLEILEQNYRQKHLNSITGSMPFCFVFFIFCFRNVIFFCCCLLTACFLFIKSSMIHFSNFNASSRVKSSM